MTNSQIILLRASINSTMNSKISLFCFSFCLAAAISMSIKDSIDVQWKDYKVKFHKTYAPENEPIRKMNFEKNIEKISLNNERFEKGEVSYKMDINSFADMDPTDYNEMQLDPPDAYDWRTQGYLSSPVRNLKSCTRADWAFATVGMLEGYLYKMDNTVKTQLSVQALIDCTRDDNKYNQNNGCAGGDVVSALDYIKEYGLPDENSYPFNAQDNNTCDANRQRNGKSTNLIIKLSSFNPHNENLMRHHISSKSPLAAGISCWKQFLNHTGGIFSDAKCINENDGAGDYYVLIVGYSTTGSDKYWIVENWKGEEWGEKGFAKVKFDADGMFSKVVGIDKDDQKYAVRKHPLSTN